MSCEMKMPLVCFKPEHQSWDAERAAWEKEREELREQVSGLSGDGWMCGHRSGASCVTCRNSLEQERDQLAARVKELIAYKVAALHELLLMKAVAEAAERVTDSYNPLDMKSLRLALASLREGTKEAGG